MVNNYQCLHYENFITHMLGGNKVKNAMISKDFEKAKNLILESKLVHMPDPFVPSYTFEFAVCSHYLGNDEIALEALTYHFLEKWDEEYISLNKNDSNKTDTKKAKAYLLYGLILEAMGDDIYEIAEYFEVAYSYDRSKLFEDLNLLYEVRCEDPLLQLDFDWFQNRVNKLIDESKILLED